MTSRPANGGLLSGSSPEFELCVRCCKSAFGGDTIAVDELGSVDWPAFLQLARRHRVQGLAWKSLHKQCQSLPHEIAEALAGDAEAIAASSLQASVASQRLLAAFENARVPLQFLKGLTLGALAYGNAALKAAIDIDLLIDPTDLGAAAELLRNEGYELVVPRKSPGDRVLHAWHREWKESIWGKQTPPLQIDLHTRTADNRRMIPGIDVHSRFQLVDIGNGVSLPTLADDELFAYLAVHGASAAWFRLKWVADFAGFLEGRESAEIDRLYRRSQELGAGRAADQGLLLADRLFGTLECHPQLRAELMNDAGTRRLYRAALKMLIDSREPTERAWGTMAIHWTQLLLLPGAAYQCSELTCQAKRLLVRALS